MDEYSYSSSMEEDTAHNCVEMTKPMGLALEGLNLVSLLFFFIVDQPLLIPLLTLFFHFSWQLQRFRKENHRPRDLQLTQNQKAYLSGHWGKEFLFKAGSSNCQKHLEQQFKKYR